LNAVSLHTPPSANRSTDVARISGTHIRRVRPHRGAMIARADILDQRDDGSVRGHDDQGRTFRRCGYSRKSPGRAGLGHPVEPVASLMLFTRSFEAVLDFIQFSLLFCSFFTVLGVIKLRITRPDLPRPYRAGDGSPLWFSCS
jgi:APA family basic amino acid/polyamine antiporter